jgi:hypothetical protein
MVDACNGAGTESDNEFIFFLNGNTNLPVDNIAIDLPNNNDITIAGTADFSPNGGTQTPTTAPGCSFVTLDDGGTIPANAPVIIFTSNDLEFSYNLSSLCGLYGNTIYLLFKNQDPTAGTFANANAATRSTILSIVTTYTGCDATYTYTNTSATTDGVYYRFPVPTGSPATATTNQQFNNGCDQLVFSTLPLTITNLSAKKQNETTFIQWKGNSTDDISYFEIEKSTTADSYITIGRVNALNGDQQYSFIDPVKNAGIVYYRIKMITPGETNKYSSTIKMYYELKGLSLNTVYPAPASSLLNVHLVAQKAEAGELLISDLNGRIVLQNQLRITKGVANYSIDITRLFPGNYIMKINTAENTVVTKFIKQ